jgi:hypothetical protein
MARIDGALARTVSLCDACILVDDRPAPTLVLLPGLDGTGMLFKAFVEALKPRVETQIVAYPVDRPLGYAELEVLVRAALPTDRRFSSFASRGGACHCGGRRGSAAASNRGGAGGR